MRQRLGNFQMSAPYLFPPLRLFRFYNRTSLFRFYHVTPITFPPHYHHILTTFRTGAKVRIAEVVFGAKFRPKSNLGFR